MLSVRLVEMFFIWSTSRAEFNACLMPCLVQDEHAQSVVVRLGNIEHFERTLPYERCCGRMCIAYCKQRTKSNKDIIGRLVLIYEVLEPNETANYIEYL